MLIPGSASNRQFTNFPEPAQALIEAGKLDGARADAVYLCAQHKRTGFVGELIASGAVHARDLALAMSSAFSVPALDLDALDSKRLPVLLLNPAMCATLRLLPLSKRNNRLLVATADPTDQQALEKIKMATDCVVDWVVVEHDKLARLLATQASHTSPLVDQPALLGEIDFGDLPLEALNPGFDEKTGLSDVEDAPVVKFLQKMLTDAVHMRASDLHFEPYENAYRVRFRVDGELREVSSPPIGVKDKLASRIKVISRLDIAEKRLPQDGRMKLRISADRSVDFRVSTLPTLFGEKIVIRVLDPSSAQMGIDALGYDPPEKQRLLEAISKPYGMVLVTGPTGSGKTVSLYTCLNILNQPGVNISSAEDPSEINLPGVNQVNINEKAGLHFSTALRAFLRQDPDVIMVGEIRDRETADIAIKAAQTGHLVLSTLHTNDAPATLTRMLDMGIPAFNIAASVTLITAQRLCRKLCPHCKAPAELPRTALLEAGFTSDELDGHWIAYKPVGCPACNTGYQGRVGLYQVMPVSEEIQRIILRGGSTMDISEQAKRQGIRTLRESGLVKVKLGITSLEEVVAITNH